MAHQVIERPNAYCFSKNEIRYGYNVTDLERPGLYLETKLYYKILTGLAKLNWVMNEEAYDCNLFIKVNGETIREIFYTSQGFDFVKAGDTVTLIVPIFVAWPSEGDPYAKLRVLKDGVEVYNEYSDQQDAPNWITYEFVVEADKVYTIKAYTKNAVDFPPTNEIIVIPEDPYTYFTSFKLKPNSDGKVYLPIQQYIDSLLNYVLPTSAVSKDQGQTCKFFLLSREVTDADPNPNYTNTEASKPRIAIKGGIESHRYARNNFFVNYFDVQKPFFTWQPSHRMVWVDQPLYLTVFSKDGSLKGCVLRVKHRTTANVETITNISLTQEGFIVHIKTDPASLGIPTADLYWWEVSIVKGVDIIVSGYRYYKNYDPVYNATDLISINSLGGVDTIRLTGEITSGIERNNQDAEGGFKTDEWSSIVKSHHASQQGITYRRTFKGDVGYQRTIEEQESLIGVLLSTLIYRIIDSRYVPVIINQKNLQLRKSTDKLVSFPVEGANSGEDEVFTPEHIELGLGSDTEEY